jgi:hypothetical protein
MVYPEKKRLNRVFSFLGRINMTGCNQNCWRKTGCRIKSGMTIAALSGMPAKAEIHIEVKAHHF